MNETTKQMPDLRDIDFCVHTFENHEGLERLLLSITETFKGARLIIADSSHEHDRAYYKVLRTQLGEAGLLNRMYVHQIPYKASQGEARNFLMENSPMKYKVFLTDENVVTEETDVRKMAHILETHPSIGVVMGTVNEDIPPSTGHASMDQDGVSFYRTAGASPFCMVRKDVYNYTRWSVEAQDVDADFATRMTRVPFQMVAVPDVVIIKELKTENAIATEPKDPTQDKEPTGTDSGAPTERSLQSGDENRGNDPVLPSGKNEESKNTTGGRR